MIKKIIGLILILTIIISFVTVYGYESNYETKTIDNKTTKFITINMDSGVTTKILNAEDNMTKAASLETMAKEVQAIAAINGTYFEAYEGNPIPWGTIIKDGKVIHISNGKSVAGITSEGKLIVDKLSFDIKGFVNGVLRSIPWRINHASQEPEAITIFTEEYGAEVKLKEGAKAAIIEEDEVIELTNSNFVLSKGSYAVVYNPKVAYLLEDRIKLGDEFRYEVKINTTLTKREEWNEVVNAIGAGPSLIVNGIETADGLSEGFTEAKINTNPSSRSFIGSDADNNIVIGNMGGVTLKEAAKIAKEMGLINAMCLDGGWSIALYYPDDGINIGGRDINNGLAFISYNGETAKSTTSKILFNSEEIQLEAYNIKGNNYFKLRDLAMLLRNSTNKFNVEWNGDIGLIELFDGIGYKKVGGEMLIGDGKDKLAKPTKAKISMNGIEIKLESYNINDNNYFKLRDVGKLIGFNVNWNDKTRTVEINTK